MSNVGFRIYTKINRPDQQVTENFRGLPVAVIVQSKSQRQAIVNRRYDRSAYTEEALRKMGCEVIDAAWSEQAAEERV